MTVKQLIERLEDACNHVTEVDVEVYIEVGEQECTAMRYPITAVEHVGDCVEIWIAVEPQGEDANESDDQL